MHESEARACSVGDPCATHGHAEALLERMQVGDREAVGEFITRYGERIRRRVRGQLGPAMRSVFDSQEILSTVARRLDALVHEQKLRACQEDQLWSLVFRIATNAVIDKAKVFRRLRRAEGGDRTLGAQLLADLERADREGELGGEVHVERMLGTISDPVDREIMELWLRNVPHVGIARALGMPAGTVRRRWAGIKVRIRQGFA